MNFMVSSRQPLIFLKEVNEIRVDYADINRLIDFVTEEWVCSAEIVIYISKNQIVDWKLINNYKEALNITIAVEDTKMIPVIKELGYKVFWSYPASTYWELRGLLDLGVNQILIDAPIFFDLPKVKNICGDVELRTVVNKCYNSYMVRKDGVCGPYIRPEDIEVYTPFIKHFEFDTDGDLSKEFTLYTIYTKDKEWSGNLNILLTNFKVDVDNRGFEVIPNEENDDKFFAHARLTCGQRCQNTKKCNLCHATINLINEIQHFSEKINPSIKE